MKDNLIDIMNSKVFLLAAVILASGCIHSGGTEPVEAPSDQEPSTSEPVETSSGSNTVYLTSSGFEPATVTIEQGETVTWINNASLPMEVASDRHPTHTDYAGSTRSEHCQNGDQTTAAFDQCQEGDRFSFTFEKTGEWSYHNHESAGQTGTVIVE